MKEISRFFSWRALFDARFFSFRNLANQSTSFYLLSGKYEVSTGADSSVCISHGKALVEVGDRLVS